MVNTNITDIEIIKISEKSSAREKAFFAIIRQSGLKPNIIRQLRIKHLEKIRDSDTPIPCKIDVPREIAQTKFGRHPSFIGEEAVKFLKSYLKKRELHDKEKLTPESLLFTTRRNTQIETKEIGRTFKKTAQRVIRKELQLNALREFFKQKSKEMERNHLNYLMGNTPEKNYTPEDDEFYRNIYRDTIMDSLEIEPTTPSEIKKQLQKETQELRDRLEIIEDTLFPKPPQIRKVTDWEAEADEIHEWIRTHPEEAKLEQEWYQQMVEEQTFLEKMMKENPDGFVAYVHKKLNTLEALQRIFKTARQKHSNTKG